MLDVLFELADVLLKLRLGQSDLRDEIVKPLLFRRWRLQLRRGLQFRQGTSEFTVAIAIGERVLYACMYPS